MHYEKSCCKNQQITSAQWTNWCPRPLAMETAVVWNPDGPPLLVCLGSWRMNLVFFWNQQHTKQLPSVQIGLIALMWEIWHGPSQFYGSVIWFWLWHLKDEDSCLQLQWVNPCRVMNLVFCCWLLSLRNPFRNGNRSPPTSCGHFSWGSSSSAATLQPSPVGSGLRPLVVFDVTTGFHVNSHGQGGNVPCTWAWNASFFAGMLTVLQCFWVVICSDSDIDSLRKTTPCFSVEKFGLHISWAHVEAVCSCDGGASKKIPWKMLWLRCFLHDSIDSDREPRLWHLWNFNASSTSTWTAWHKHFGGIQTADIDDEAPNANPAWRERSLSSFGDIFKCRFCVSIKTYGANMLSIEIYRNAIRISLRDDSTLSCFTGAALLAASAFWRACRGWGESVLQLPGNKGIRE